MSVREVNFDGIVGPTHNYGGLSFGNLASQRSVRAASNPREAAKQGLQKMKVLHDLGVLQGVFPPQDRPAVDVLRRLGFTGDDARVLERARRDDPRLLIACSSASSMWAANAATVCPSSDSADGKAHFTPANLMSHFHRSLEPPATATMLAAIFSDSTHFVHHRALPAVDPFGDEGAANHMRVCAGHDQPGTHLFVYGRRALDATATRPKHFPARQTFEASAAIARLHTLDSERAVFARQLPRAIDAGAFHNDVVTLGNENLLIVHEEALVDQQRVLSKLRDRMNGALQLIEVPSREVTLAEAVSTYLFNSQLVTLTSGKMALIVPEECRDHSSVWAYLEHLVAEHAVIERLLVVEVRQSMKNGGGPACLRLRVVLNDDELARVNGRVFLDDDLFAELVSWVDRHYRERLTEDDLADPGLLEESRTALDELTQVLALGSIYPFQR